MKKKDKSTFDDAPRALREALKAESGFILIYNGDTDEAMHLWKGLCSHDARDFMKSALEAMQAEEDQEDDCFTDIPEKLVN